MRPTSIATIFLTSGLLVSSHARIIPFYTNTKQPSANVDADTDARQAANQRPIMDNTPGIQLPQPPSNNDKDDSSGDRDRNSAVILSDVLGSDRAINIFASLCRSVDPVSRRLDTSNLNTTVLAPLNSAISSLPHKPWEDSREYAALGASAYEGKSGEDRAHQNLRRFVEAHVVPVSPWGEGEKVQRVGSSGEGGEVWWESVKDGDGGKGEVVKIMPEGVEVDKVVQKVANGEVWVLRRTLGYGA